LTIYSYTVNVENMVSS